MRTPEHVAVAVAAPYHRLFVREEDGGYSSWVLELPGVFGGGDTIDEANRTLEEALADWVQIELERGHDIPQPVDPQEYSGRLQLRIPPSLHQQAAMRAQIEGVSLNRILSDAVAQVMGRESVPSANERPVTKPKSKVSAAAGSRNPRSTARTARRDSAVAKIEQSKARPRRSAAR